MGERSRCNFDRPWDHKKQDWSPSGRGNLRSGSGPKSTRGWTADDSTWGWLPFVPPEMTVLGASDLPLLVFHSMHQYGLLSYFTLWWLALLPNPTSVPLCKWMQLLQSNQMYLVLRSVNNCDSSRWGYKPTKSYINNDYRLASAGTSQDHTGSLCNDSFPAEFMWGAYCSILAWSFAI